MQFPIAEHELRMEGLQPEPLEFKYPLSEAAISTKITDYERDVRESCEYDPMFVMRIEALQDNYSLDELKYVLSASSGDMFSARNELERFVSLNTEPGKDLPPEAQRGFAECCKKLAYAVIRHEMLQNAIKRKEQVIMGNIDGIGKSEANIENNKYAEGNGTGVEFTAEGIALANGFVDAYYKAHPMETSHDREMDDVSLEQLREKQAICDEFLARHEIGAQTMEAPDNSTPADIPNATQNDSEPGALQKAAAIAGVSLALWGMQGAITRPVNIEAPPVEEPLPVTEFAPSDPHDWNTLAEGLSKLAGGDKIEIVSLEAPVKIEDLPPLSDDDKKTKKE